MSVDRGSGIAARRLAGMRTTLSLSWRVFVHTIGAKYRKSFLGYFWMIAPALLITGGVTLASRAGVISPGATGLPYPLFVFIGTLLWQVFAEAEDVPHQAFEGARTFLTRVNFPREAIILAQLYECLINTGVRLVIALLLIAVAHGLDARGAGLITAAFTGSVLLGVGLGALLMPFTLLFSDLHNTIKLVLGYGLFLTPAMYVPTGDGLFATCVRWNPVSVLMNTAREAAMGQAVSSVEAFVAVLAAGLATTLVGVALARIAAPIVIERMLLGGR